VLTNKALRQKAARPSGWYGRTKKNWRWFCYLWVEFTGRLVHSDLVKVVKMLTLNSKMCSSHCRNVDV